MSARGGMAALAGADVTAALESLTHRMRRVTARVQTRGRGRFAGIGAGVVWPAPGERLVVTNAHVTSVEHGRWPIVELGDGRSFEARLVARDDRRDLALLSLEDSDRPLETAVPGNARHLRVGELLVAVGHPLGFADSLSVGVVHAMRGNDDGWVRADIRLAPGNSGGPLATLDGSVVGINSMVVRGLGVAIAAHVVANFVAEACGTMARDTAPVDDPS